MRYLSGVDDPVLQSPFPRSSAHRALLALLSACLLGLMLLAVCDSVWPDGEGIRWEAVKWRYEYVPACDGDESENRPCRANPEGE